MVRIFFRDWDFFMRKYISIGSVASFFFRHDECTDDVDDDGRSWQ